MPRLSVSYRRSDSADVTGRIFDRLVKHYGRKSVFRDIDSVPAGVDFRKHIRNALHYSDVLLAVIGPDWRGTKPEGSYRVEEDNDLVRVEVETALKQGVPVVPILVGAANMPTAEQLPDCLKELSYRNAARVDSGQDFDHHLDRLIRQTDSIVASKAKGARRYALWGLAAALPLLLALAGGGYWWLSEDVPSRTPWLEVAHSELGEEEINGPENNPRILDYIASVQSTRGVQDDEVDWASAFVEWSLNQVGIEGPQSMDPDAWLGWGKEIVVPEKGCVTVFSFKGLGHVGFFMNEEGKSVDILGGNQSDLVKVSRYARKDIISWRLPISPVLRPDQQSLAGR